MSSSRNKLQNHLDEHEEVHPSASSGDKLALQKKRYCTVTVRKWRNCGNYSQINAEIQIDVLVTWTSKCICIVD
jgi:hypothetical protein